jgi:hypothetical protein
MRYEEESICKEVVVAKFNAQHLSEGTENYWQKLGEDDTNFSSEHLEQRVG